MKGNVLMIYFDNAATTAPSEKACKAVSEGLMCFGNPSSLHRLGLNAEKLLDIARDNIASVLGVQEHEIYFTSGATESNNTAILGAARKFGKRKKRIVTTSVEHPSVSEVCTRLENDGFEVIRVSPGTDGKINAADIINSVDDNTFLVTCMYVNNENGFILPVEKAFSVIKKKYPDVITHCDCVQAFLKLPIKAKKLNADLISLSAHKIHGPKGIGALYVKKGVNIPAFIVGGGQERAFRSGTESVPLICGFSAAVKELSENIDRRYEYAKSLQTYLFDRCSEFDNIHINCDSNCSPYVNSIAISNIKSEVLLHFLEERDIFVSSGSACSKGKKSSVLKNFRVAENYLDSTIRISFSKDNTKFEIDSLIEAFVDANKKLCKIR